MSSTGRQDSPLNRLRVVETALAGLLLLAATTGCRDAPSTSSSAAIVASALPLDIRIPGPHFELTDEKGKPFGSDDMQTKVWVVDFVFTSCPSVCPELTHKMAKVLERTADVPSIHFLSVSVDPENDTPEKLAAFVAKNGVTSDRWSLVTGAPAAVEDAIRGFKIGFSRSPGGLLTHDEHFVLVDREGTIRGYFVANDDGLVDLEKQARRLAK